MGSLFSTIFLFVVMETNSEGGVLLVDNYVAGSIDVTHHWDAAQSKLA